MDQDTLESRLDSFDPAARRGALRALAALPLPAPAGSENVNLHFHSFFSFNAEGWSPSHIAWEAYRAGLYAAGLCDFDVLDGVEEFLQAGEALGVRATANLETRVFLREYADVDINSPGEPGVSYIMGAGFVAPPPAGTPQAAGLEAFRTAARSRNLELVGRINPELPDIAVDYEHDVLPLTPLGVATERHIVRAYVNKSVEVSCCQDSAVAIWSVILGKPFEQVVAMWGTPALEEAVRSKLVKRGGVGYVQPSMETFPLADDFVKWVLSCRAIPMVTWLDGTSAGEKDPRAMLECMMAKGCAALNIIPDRNWNIKDPDARAKKIACLDAMVAAADDLQLPINIGTEMNRAGLPFVDDLAGPVLSRHKASFLRGARIMVGHSILFRYADVSYVTFGGCLPEKNAFFESVGALPPLTAPVAAELAEMGPAKAFRAISDAASKGAWPA